VPGAAVVVELRVAEVDGSAVRVLQLVDLVERVRAGDTVGGKTVSTLEPLHGRLGRGAVHAVDDEVLARGHPAGHADLQLPDVAAGRAATERAVPGVTSIGRRADGGSHRRHRYSTQYQRQNGDEVSDPSTQDRKSTRLNS